MQGRKGVETPRKPNTRGMGSGRAVRRGGPRMSTRKRVEVIVLLALAVALGYFAYERIGMRMGGNPSPLISPFESEEEWVIDQVVRDLAEMAAHGRELTQDAVEVSLARDAPGSHYRVEVRV